MNTEDVISFFKSGEKEKKEFKLGLEWEVFLVDYETLKPATFFGAHGISEILKDLAHSLGLQIITENSNIAFLQGETYSITLEGGGQVELSGNKYDCLKDNYKECELFISALKDVCRTHNKKVMMAAYHPLAREKDVLPIPDSRYIQILNYFKLFGQELAADMVKLTTSIQCSIDYSSEADFVKKLRIISALSPLFSAIYCNSPIVRNEKSHYVSYRGHVWQNTENRRSGIIRGVFDEDFNYLNYAKYLKSLPMIQGSRVGEPNSVLGISFEDYEKEYGVLKEEDFLRYISFSYTVVRAKRFIEIRCFDNQRSLAMMMSVPALIKGLFYSSEDIFDKVGKISEYFDHNDLFFIKNEVNKTGLRTIWKGISILEMARELYKLSSEALNLYYPEESFLILPLEKYLFELNCSPGYELGCAWDKYGKNIHKIKNEFFLNP